MTEYDKHTEVFTIACDFCTEAEEIHSDSYIEGIEHAKSKGWVNFKENGIWKNRCPECVTGIA